MSGRPTERELAALRARIEQMSLDGATEMEIAVSAGISERAVRRHLVAIRASWAQRNPQLEEARGWLIALAVSLDRTASQGVADLPADSSVRVGYLKLRLGAQERLARLIGADTATRKELAVPNGGPINVDEHRPLSRIEMLRRLSLDSDELP